MPIASYRSWVGIAADRSNGQLTSAISSSATSLPVTNLSSGTSTLITSAGATYSAIIVDGPLTEVVACSGNLTSGSIACAATANAHSANVYVMFQLTASVGPTAYLPVEKFNPIDTYAQLYDKTLRGYQVDSIGAVAGVRTSAWDLSGPIFADTYGYILGGLFGSEDYTVGTPSTHAFAVMNTGTYQPVAYALYFYDGVNVRIFAGGKFTESTISIDPKALMMHATKYIARASGVVATSYTTAFTTILPTTSWSASTTIGASSSLVCLTGQITFSRLNPDSPVTLQGIQDPYTIWVGQMSVKGQLDVVKEDDAQLSNYFNESQPILKWAALTGSGSTQTGITVQCTKANYETAKTDTQTGGFVRETFTFEAIANTTDKTTAGTGYSPAKVTLTNAVASGTTYV